MGTAGLVPFHARTAAFRDGSDTPRAFLERALERVEEAEPTLRAFQALAVQRARMTADAATERWAEGQPLSLIDGMPIGIKDIIETFDLPTTMGSPVWAGWMAGCDAASVFALREAGAVILGKTKTTEFASSFPADTTNPWDRRRSPGGSSAGSAAAVGAGILPAALGTQVVGSVLRPASFCGAIGYKPSLGGINRGGSHDFQSHSCIGVIGASLADVWHTAKAIVARVGGDPGALGIIGPDTLPPAARPARLARLETAGWAVAGDAAKAQFEGAVEALRRAGVAIASRADDRAVATLEDELADAAQVCGDIISHELRWFVKGTAYKDRLGVSPRQLKATLAADFDQARYHLLLARRDAVRRAFERVAAGFDGFLSLSAVGAAPLGFATTGNTIFNVPASLLGAPALTLPALVEDGMPLGLQLFGRMHSDAAIFAAAGWIGTVLGSGGAWAA